MQLSTQQQHRTEQFRKFSKYATDNGGTLLSPAYINSITPLLFRCGSGHEFASPPGSMWHRKSWCKVCAATANRAQQLSGRDMLKEMQDIARQRGGACASTEYVRSDAKLHFTCADGHSWETRPNDIRRGTWCPSCSNKTESLVRRYLECRYGTAMPSKRLPWLIDSEGKQRVLDGYSEELKLAFEYHGVQHFEHVTYFHTNKSLQQQQHRDAFVRDACAAAGVILIEVPTLPDGFNQECLLEHMESLLSAMEDLPSSRAGGVAQFMAMPQRTSKLTEMHALAQAKGGRCLATKFMGTNAKLTWACVEGHQWSAPPKTIKKGHWCPYCSKCRRVSPLESLHQLAADRGGICLTKEYVNGRSKVDFLCKEKHTFSSRGDSVLGHKSWCPVCAGNKVAAPLERIRKIVEAKGGALLSTNYVNSRTKVSVRCSQGHTWDTTPVALVHAGSWCKRCACRNTAVRAAAARANGLQAPAYRAPLALLSNRPTIKAYRGLNA